MKLHTTFLRVTHRRALLEAMEARRLLSGVLNSIQAGEAVTPAAEQPQAVIICSNSSARAPTSSGPVVAMPVASLVESPRPYLTGNSMTDGVWYKGLVAMLARDGMPVTLGRQTGPGFAQSDNLNLASGFSTSGVDPARPVVPDPWGNYQVAFASAGWDALTLQPHERRLLVSTDPIDRTSTQNQGEVPISIEFMKCLAFNSPGAQVCGYSRPARRTDLDSKGQPTGAVFNYSAEWLKPYIDTGSNRNYNFFTRSRTQQYMTLVREAQWQEPRTKEMKPVRVIPAGEAYYNVDQMIKGGEFAGTPLTSILDLYVDGSHPSNIGAYVLALTFYSALTGCDPRGVAPNEHYVDPGDVSPLSDPQVQAKLQKAVYSAMTYAGYAGWTTPIPLHVPFRSLIAEGTTPLIMQAEDFDDGGESVAYHDLDASNTGGAYRNTSVDVQASSDAVGGYHVGFIKAREWLEYTVDIRTPDLYAIDFSVASNGTGGRFHLEVDGRDVTGPLVIPNTRGWQNWQTVTKNSVALAAGTHTLRIVFDANGVTGSVGNLNHLQLTATGSTPPEQAPFRGTPFAIGGDSTTIQLEDFDEGGEGVAHCDLDASNLGGAYRASSVDLQPTSDSGGGFNVGWACSGEWLEYTADVARSGMYNLEFRVASNGAGGTFHLEVDGKDVTGPLTVPNTYGWQKWKTISGSNVRLDPGRHVLRLAFDTSGPTGNMGNFNYLTITPAVTAPLTISTDTAAYVRDGSYAQQNYGNDGALEVKKSTLSWSRETYLRFSLIGVASIGSATLRLFGQLSDSQTSLIHLDVYGCSDTAWIEPGLTWNTRPAAGRLVISAPVAGVSAQWHEVDVTSYLQAEKQAGRNAVTLVLRSNTFTSTMCRFNSDEAAANRPELVINQ